MKRILFGMVWMGAVFGLVCCAPNAANGITTPDTTGGSGTTGAATLPAVSPTAPATDVLAMATMTSTETAAPDTVTSELVAALALAAGEMRAAERTATLAEAQMRAEGAVNILVGKFGRWYGDQDGDGVTYDPSSGRGVLPGEVVTQGADLDQAKKFPAGLALMAAGTNPNPPALARLLGDADVWRTQPRDGYDGIEAALGNANGLPELDTLHGTVPRAVGFARLMLTRAKTVEDARALATRAAAELDGAVREARMLTP